MLHPQPAGLAAVLTALPAWLFSEDAASRALHEVVRAVLSVIVSLCYKKNERKGRRREEQRKSKDPEDLANPRIKVKDCCYEL